MSAKYTAIATNTGGRAGKVSSSDGVINMDLRPPKEMGGPGGNYTNPEQLFAAGYATCFGGALGHIALVKGIRVKATTTAKVTIHQEENGGFHLSVEMDVIVPGVSQKEAEELAEEAHQFCPYSKAIKGNVEVKINARAE